MPAEIQVGEAALDGTCEHLVDEDRAATDSLDRAVPEQLHAEPARFPERARELAWSGADAKGRTGTGIHGDQ
jgi:hypothetical protein